MNPQIKQTLLIICLQTLGLRLQRYNKICKCARKITFSCVFLLSGLSPSTKQVADIGESRLARRESVEQRIGGRVRGKYWMIIDWYRSGIEVASKLLMETEKCNKKGFFSGCLS